jgi:hypothetical protein
MPRFLLLLLTAALAACASTPPSPDGDAAGGDTTRGALDAARARWDVAGLDDYRFTFGNSCFCPEDVRGPFAITVRDGAVAEVLFQGAAVAADPERHLTVDALFDRLEAAFDRGADLVQVTYDADLGYPVSAYVDYEAMATDEEDRFEVSALTPLDG